VRRRTTYATVATRRPGHRRTGRTRVRHRARRLCWPRCSGPGAAAS